MRRALVLATLTASLAACGRAPAARSAPPRLGPIPAWVEGSAGRRVTTLLPPREPVPIAAPVERPRARGRRVTLDLVAADLPNVCRLIGELAGVNVVVSDGVSGSVTMKLRDVPWDEALDAILLAKGYHAERVGSVVVVRAK